MTSPTTRPGPSRRIPVAIFVVIALALLAAGYGYYRKEAEEIRLEKHEEIAAIGELKSGQVQQWRKERLADVQRFARGPQLRQRAADFLRNPSSTGYRADLLEMLQLNRVGDQYHNVLLFAPDGHMVLSTEDPQQPVDPATQRIVEAALTHNESYLSDFFRDPDGIVHIDVAAAVRNTEGQSMAVIILRSSAGDYLFPLIQSWPTRSPSAETLLIQRDGEEVLYLNELRHRSRTALALRLPMNRADLPAGQALLGKQGTFEGKDYRGVEVLANLRPIPDSPWFMVAKVDANEILAEARYRAGLISLMVGSLILLTAVAVAYVYRHQQAALFHDLYDSERQQREAQKTFRTILYSIGDAVITTDRGGFVREMNPVAEKLTGWPEADAQGLPLEQIFRTIHEETRATMENPVDQVLRMGAVVALANHTLLIAQDGTERAIADSAAPIRDNSGTINGVVLVFSDQTTQRAAQKALRRSEQHLRAVIGADPECVKLIDQSGKLLEMNAAGLAMLEADSLQDVQDCGLMAFIRPEYHAAFGALHKIVMKGESGMLEFEATGLKGTRRWLNTHAVPLRDANGQVSMLLGITRDITERKRAEETIRASSQKLTLLFQQSPIGIIEWDMSFRVTRWNPAAEKIFGFTAEEASGQHGMFIVPESAYALVGSMLENLLKGEGSERSTNENVRKDGAIITCDWYNTSLTDAEGQVVGVAAQVQDITERKAAEARIQRLTQLYVALSQCNQAIVRCANEGELFPQICRGAVLFGGMKMAWIGLVDHSARRVVPVASFGDDFDYLKDIQISLDADDPLGRGPEGTAIREGRPFWCQDFQNDPITAPWHERGLRSGWRGSATLPLYRNGVVIAALTLYSDQVNAFDGDACNLLMEMAADISHAMDSFEAEAERKRAGENLLASQTRAQELSSRLHAILESPHGMVIFALDANYRYTAFTATHKAVMRTIWGVEIALGMNMLDAIRDPIDHEKAKRNFDRALAGEHLTLVEEYGNPPNRAFYEDRYSPVLDGAHKVSGLAVFVIDVTARKQADETLRASLREKESLLKEVHHRVKNNLQVITSLLRLEAGRSDEPGTKTVLKEMQNRIRSMALLHETLYRSENLERVDLPGYIQRLTTHLFRSMVGEPGSIQLRLDMAPVNLALDQAVPCGLLINELVSNCLKHGFPNGRTGEVRIDLQLVDGGEKIRLRVSDTGVGLPADFEEKRTQSLGLQLVSDLTKQLKGQLDVSGESGKGAVFEVMFAPNKINRDEGDGGDEKDQVVL